MLDRVICAAACLAVLGLNQPTRADCFPGNIVNPGAEFGAGASIVGWSNTMSYFSAVNNPPSAHAGNWYFETNQIFNFPAAAASGALSQNIDLSAYTGQMSAIRVSVAAAQEPGAAFVQATNTSYVYSAVVAARFYDSGGGSLSPGHAVLTYNMPTWGKHSVTFSALPFMGSIATIRLEAYGGWTNLTTGTTGHFVDPGDITDTPLWTRFDSFAVEVEVSSFTPPCLNNPTCAAGAWTTIFGGDPDSFCAAPEPATPGAVLAASGFCTGSVDFDVLPVDDPVCHTITGLPAGITDAVLEIKMRASPNSQACNDTLALQADGAGGFAWGRRIGSAAVGLCFPAGNGLLPVWQPGDTETFCLDLRSLPNPDGSCTNIVPLLNTDGRLDIRIQDDTGVDYVRLWLGTCPCVDPPPGMVSWWTFDEPTGLLAVDLAGGNPGGHTPMASGPTPMCSMVDGSLYFDGVDDGVVVNDDPTLNFGTGPFSIDAWILPDSPPNGNIVGKYDVGTFHGFTFQLVGGVPTLTMEDGFVNCQTGAIAALVPGVWHHVAVTVSGDSPREIFFYGNGQPIGTPQYLGCGDVSSAAPLIIGGDAAPFTTHFAGRIDEVEIFNRVLASVEIQEIYEARGAGKCKCSCPADVNGDGVIDGLDIAAFNRCITGMWMQGDHCPCADFDGDSLVGLGDVSSFVTAVLAGGICP